MKELSLHVLDIAQNSVSAGADRIEISLELRDVGLLEVSVSDNGCGMSEEMLQRVADPFYNHEDYAKSRIGYSAFQACGRNDRRVLFDRKPGWRGHCREGGVFYRAHRLASGG